MEKLGASRQESNRPARASKLSLSGASDAGGVVGREADLGPAPCGFLTLASIVGVRRRRLPAHRIQDAAHRR
jgi:hypothetical protein